MFNYQWGKPFWIFLIYNIEKWWYFTVYCKCCCSTTGYSITSIFRYVLVFHVFMSNTDYKKKRIKKRKGMCVCEFELVNYWFFHSYVDMYVARKHDTCIVTFNSGTLSQTNTTYFPKPHKTKKKLSIFRFEIMNEITFIKKKFLRPTI